MKNCKNADSQIYWYAKGRFVRSKNLFNDLRKIYARRNGVYEEHISDKDILEMMLSLAYQHIKSEYNFKAFIFNIFKTWPRNPQVPFSYIGVATKKRLLQQLLTLIALTQIRDANKILIHLDEPDFTILPSHAEWADKKMFKWIKTHMSEIQNKNDKTNRNES